MLIHVNADDTFFTLVSYQKHNIPMCQRTIYTHFHIIADVSNGKLDPSIFISMDGMLVRLYVRMGRRNSSTNVPTEFTCISIQMVHWYVGMLQKTHPKTLYKY